MSLLQKMMPPPRSQSRVDEWALIAQQKALEQKRAKEYQHHQEQQRRKSLKSYLDAQVQEKQMKQEKQKDYDRRYASETFRQVRQVTEAENERHKENIMRRKLVQSENRHLFSNVIDSKIKQQYQSHRPDYSMDIGHEAQLSRYRQVNQDRKKMMDELDRQIKEKERKKNEEKSFERMEEMNNLNYQYSVFDHRKKERQHHYKNNPRIYEYYKGIKENQSQKERQFDYKQIQLEEIKKKQQELQRASQKDEEIKAKNQKMKQILDQQVMIHEQRRREEERVNPEELSYGLFGRMLNKPYNPAYSQQYKQRYHQDLQNQIQEKQMKKEREKYMNDEQYKINLNQLNRAVDGKFADKTYIDRSIHAISEPHSVNVTLFDAKVQKPDAEAIKPKLEELIHRKQQRAASPLDHNKSF